MYGYYLMDSFGADCRRRGQINHAGQGSGGLVITILIGIAGALLGGFISSALGLGSVSGFNLWSLAIAVGGALLLLIGYRQVRG